MKWILLEPTRGNQFGYVFGETIPAVLFVPDVGKAFVCSKGSDLVEWPPNTAKGWLEISLDNAIAMFRVESVELGRLSALVKYGVTDEFVKKLCNKPS